MAKEVSRRRFHDIHGVNIERSTSGLQARRLSGYGEGFVFSSHPIKIGEPFQVKMTLVHGGLCFGFTSEDPRTLTNTLSCSYLDLNKQPGFWMWPLFKNYCLPEMVLFFYVARDGEVHFGIDGEEKSIFYRKVDTGEALWAILDLYGDGTTVEYVNGQQNDLMVMEALEEEEGSVVDVMKCQRGLMMCTVCFDSPVNAVLYKCGHMCMCYKCALVQWKGAQGGMCPLCRTVIIDVVRTYK